MLINVANFKVSPANEIDHFSFPKAPKLGRERVKLDSAGSITNKIPLHPCMAKTSIAVKNVLFEKFPWGIGCFLMWNSHFRGIAAMCFDFLFFTVHILLFTFLTTHGYFWRINLFPSVVLFDEFLISRMSQSFRKKWRLHRE